MDAQFGMEISFILPIPVRSFERPPPFYVRLQSSRRLKGKKQAAHEEPPARLIAIQR
jgi:hypothetical protein